MTGNVQLERVGAIKKTRRVTAFGCNSDAPIVWNYATSHGHFLPREDGAPRALAVLGCKARGELFGVENPLGLASVRRGARRGGIRSRRCAPSERPWILAPTTTPSHDPERGLPREGRLRALTTCLVPALEGTP